MAHTPLYKRLKAKGTSFYAFPGAAEDISSAYQNENFKMYFSNYILLNFPKQNTFDNSDQNNIYFDFSTFSKSDLSLPTSNFSDQLVESLRNYVANFEVTMKTSKINSTDFYYDHSEFSTPTEKIFWKWCKKLNLFDLEVANPQDEYFGNLQEFERRNLTDDDYFNEFLWREREITTIESRLVKQATNPQFLNKVQVTLRGATNLKKGDLITFVSGTTYTQGDFLDKNSNPIEDIIGYNTRILNKTTSSGDDVIILDLFSSSSTMGSSLVINLVYHRLVQYIGNVNGVNNVQESNRSYTEVWAHIPDNTGQTPDILFRTKTDRNFSPGISLPIQPSQIQSQIIGAENFQNPIVSSPQDYPGSYFGQFDNQFYTYQVSTGDQIRRRGDFFGVYGNINNYTLDSQKIDGISVDFDRDHYVKMNSNLQEITTFDEFNMLNVNGVPPRDFEFNAILWYYDLVDLNGNISKNLYGITFIDNPDNNPLPDEVSRRVPTLTKLCSTSQQDGVSYAFSLMLNFDVSNENPQDTYNPNAINSLFNFNLFNEAMKKLSLTTQSFLKVIIDQTKIFDEIQSLKGLLYSQTSIDQINSKINFLENLLRLYSSNQIVGSDTIEVNNVVSGGVSYVQLQSVDNRWGKVDVYKTSNLYNEFVPLTTSIVPPKNKDHLIRIINDDINPQTLLDNLSLDITIERDLDYKQTLEIWVESDNTSTQNKKLDINLKYQGNTINVFTKLELPVYYNIQTNRINSSARLKTFNFHPDFNQNIILFSDLSLMISMKEPGNILRKTLNIGDEIRMVDFIVGSASTVDFSGQYRILNIDNNLSKIWLDLSSSPIVSNYSWGEDITFPICLDEYLSNPFGMMFNKGFKVTITRTNSNSTNFENDYLVNYQDF